MTHLNTHIKFMTKLFNIILFSLLSFSAFGQSKNELRQELNKIISSKNATVGISIKGIEGPNDERF